MKEAANRFTWDEKQKDRIKDELETRYIDEQNEAAKWRQRYDEESKAKNEIQKTYLEAEDKYLTQEMAKKSIEFEVKKQQQAVEMGFENIKEIQYKMHDANERNQELERQIAAARLMRK
jgi:hypothetical protein